MPLLPPEFLLLMIDFQPLFSKPVFAHARLLLAGAILTPGQRTVTTALRVMGLSQQTRFHKYHRVLSHARWSPRQASRRLLERLVNTFTPAGPLVFAIDDTIERRRGQRIRAKGIYRDPVRSSRRHFVKASGLRWLSLMLLTPIPWAHRVWALPVLTVLAPSQRYHEAGRRRHKTLLDWARQMIRQLARWLPEREVIVTGDNSFSCIDFLAAVAEQATFVTRLRLDAALYAPAPPRSRRVGRPRKKGARLPTLEQVLNAPSTSWQAVTVGTWYGHRSQRLEITTGTAVWYHSGKPVVPLRWVLVRDPGGRLDPAALLSTNVELSAVEIITYFVQRWTIEVTFEEVRRHLGVETQRQWSDAAIERTTPVLLATFSVVTLLAHQLEAEGRLGVRQAAWYPKAWPTFSDALASVRQRFWRVRHLSISGPKADLVKIPRPLLQTLTETLAYAA